jgi:hypothetical protein
MTYLQMVNSVLTRLREPSISVLTGNTNPLLDLSYQELIGEFVKDAITLCENAWDWSHLREEVNFTTTNGNNNLILTGCKVGSELGYVSCDELKGFLKKADRVWMKSKSFSEPINGVPQFFSEDGYDASGNLKVKLFPTPDAVYNLKVNIVKRTDVSSLVDSSVIKIPHLPIIFLAYASALSERGEQGGNTASEQLLLAKQMLSDVIAIDAERNSEDLVWRGV